LARGLHLNQNLQNQIAVFVERLASKFEGFFDGAKTMIPDDRISECLICRPSSRILPMSNHVVQTW
jgi:hypothetical protein